MCKKINKKIEDNKYVVAREFTLVDVEKKYSTDLRDYEDEITDAVYSVFDIEEEDLIINEDSFWILNHTVETSEAIKLGKILSAKDSSLFHLCKNYPVLFVGQKVKELNMTEYYIANSTIADITDLRIFADIIKKVIKSVSPDAEVEVYKDYYAVNTLPSGKAREIEKRLGHI